MNREAALKIWQDSTRELFPHADIAALEQSAALRPIAWLRVPWTTANGMYALNTTLSPGWVDRRIWAAIPPEAFDFDRHYDGALGPMAQVDGPFSGVRGR